MSVDLSQKSDLLAKSVSDRRHFMLLCQLIACICSYVAWLSLIYFATDSKLLSSEQLRIAIGIGVGFAQLTMTGFWLAFEFRFLNLWFGFIAVALECLMVMFVSTLSVSFMPSSFFVVLTLACGIQFLAVFGTGMVFRNVFHLTLTCTDSTASASVPRAQFRIRDLLIAMAAIAFLVSIVQTKRSDFRSIASASLYFGLIIGYYNMLYWPCIVACLGRHYLRSGAIAFLVAGGLILSQQSVFLYALKSSSEPWSFFLCLDLPFLTSIAVHALIARQFGYRIKTSKLDGN